MTSRPDPMITTQMPVTAGKLARQLQTAGRGELEIEIPSGAQLDLSTTPGASVDGGKLRFARIEYRNSAAAWDVLAELGDPPLTSRWCGPQPMTSGAARLATPTWPAEGF